jgi:formate dehydrogenase gamma subunit
MSLKLAAFVHRMAVVRSMDQHRIEAAASPAALGLSDSIWLPVLALHDETRDIRTIRVARPMGFDFQPGQSVRVDVPVRGKPHTSRASISSAPESTAWVEISVKRRGIVSRRLLETVSVGSLISVQHPQGDFVYPCEDARPLVLIAGGAGCVPLMSMLRHAVLRDPSRSVTFLLSVPTADDVPFRSELNRLARSERARIGISLTRESRRSGYLAGRIGEELLRRAAPSPRDSVYRISGPAPMVEGTRRLLRKMGVPEEQLQSESVENEVPDVHLAGEAAVSTPPAVVSPAKAHEASPWTRRTPIREEEISEQLDALLRPWPGQADRPASVETLVSASHAAPRPAETSAAEAEPGESTLTARILRFPSQHPKILRFLRGERMLHWSIAIPFVTCFATGMILKFFYGLHHGGISRDFLSFFHRVSGGSLAVFPTLAVLWNWRDYRSHLYNVRVGWVWTIDDVKWLILMGPAAFSKRFTLPDQRKFNAAERLNFMTIMITYPVFVATGLALWLPGIHFLPWVIHFGVALAVAPLMFGHIHMALVNPGTRAGLSGMISGHVDREWAKHHYTSWYRDHFEEDGTPKS